MPVPFLIFLIFLASCQDATTSITSPDSRDGRRPAPVPASLPISSFPASQRDTTWETVPRHFLAVTNTEDSVYARIDTSSWRYGHVSERFDLPAGFCIPYDCTRTPRYNRMEHSSTELYRNEHVWIFFSFLVPDYAHGRWTYYAQIQTHPVPGNNNYDPTWMFLKRENQPFCMVYDFVRHVNAFDCWNEDRNIALISDAEFMNRWHDILVHLYVSESSGYTEVWVNNVYKGRRDAPTLRAGQQGSYFKYGIYQPEPPNAGRNIMVYFDELRIGPTREQVDLYHLLSIR